MLPQGSAPGKLFAGADCLLDGVDVGRGRLQVDSLALFAVPASDLATLDERARTHVEAAR
jgi:hypothetical protein